MANLRRLGAFTLSGVLVFSACSSHSEPLEPVGDTFGEPSDIVESATAEVDRLLEESPQAPSVNSGSDCDSNYSGNCVPLVGYDLDCPDVVGPVYVVGQDVHGFDRDGDGVGCEPWTN